MATIKICNLQVEIEDLTTAESEEITGGDNPGMAPPGAYEAGVSGCHGATGGSKEGFWECIMML
jgi:hypothetical protein